MSKSPGTVKRSDKRSKHGDKKHDERKHKSHNLHKEKKRSLMSSSNHSSQAAAGSSSSGPQVFTESGPHGSVFVKAIRGSQFLNAKTGSYAIQEEAYMKEVLDASEGRTVVMKCQMSRGVLTHATTRQAKFSYPDGSFMHCVPICDVRVFSMQGVYRLGRGREFINKPSEVYGRDSVLLRMRTKILIKLQKHASHVYSSEYPSDRISVFGQADEDNEDIANVPCTVNKNAKVKGKVRGSEFEKSVARIAGEEQKDIVGDVLIAVKYVRNHEKRTGEIQFEVQEVKVRRGAERLFNGAGAGPSS